jgi:hypothetical protein
MPIHRRTLLAVTVLGARPSLAETAPIGRVWAAAGLAIAEGPAGRRELAPGAPVFADDTIRTGTDGRVRIETFAGVSVIVGPATEVQIARHLTGGEGGLRAAFRLAAGILRLIGGAVAGPVEIVVETPQAIAAVRSTDWLVELGPAGTGVLVLHGRVAVEGRIGGGVVLSDGEGTDIAPGRPPAPPRPWGLARREAAVARTAT